MPRAEEDNSPRGLGYGEEQALKDQTLPDSGGAPLASPMTVPQAPTEEAWKPPAPEPQVPNVDPNTGWNYDEILMQPSQRSAEPVTSGLTGSAPKVSEVLKGLSQVSDSPDIRALLRNALQMGM